MHNSPMSISSIKRSCLQTLLSHVVKGALLLTTTTGCIRSDSGPLCQDAITHPLQISHLETLWSPPIDPKASSAIPAWQIEAHLGDQFARKLEWQEAIRCYKRAALLTPNQTVFANQVLNYNTFLCHYLANQPQLAAQTFETSALVDIAPSFPAYRDLLTTLGDSYRQLSLVDSRWQSKKEYVQRLLSDADPDRANTLYLRSLVQSGNSKGLISLSREKSDLSPLQPLMMSYRAGMKSAKKAGLLNALCPGAGYWYVGMKQTALTSFALNALFGAAAWRFLRKGDTAAGLIALSFEAGWYLGGIQGAFLAADTHNRRRFEPFGEKILREKNAHRSKLIHRGF